MMQRPVVLFLVLVISTVSQSQELQGKVPNIYYVLKQMTLNDSLITTNSTNNGNTTDDHNYIAKIAFDLNERTIQPYLRDEIFYRYDLHSITTSDLIELFNLENRSLNETWDVLHKLNISDSVLNVSNFGVLLDFSNLTFKDFYEKLQETTDLSGVPLQNAFEILNIDLSNFSLALTIGVPKIYDVLNTGVYSVENFEKACQMVGTDLNNFYKNAKAIILNQMKLNSIRYFDEKLKSMPSMDKNLYDKFWMVSNLNVSDIYRVAHLKSIVDGIFNHLNENVTLGVVISDHEIVFHRKIFKKMETVRQIVNIKAHSLINSGIISDSLVPMAGLTDQSMILWSNNTMNSKLEVARDYIAQVPRNCTYVFSHNDTFFVEKAVDIINMTQMTLIIEARNLTQFQLGNPLLCDGKLVGLAKEINNENRIISFDTFYKSTETPTSGSTIINIFTFCLHMIPLLLILFIC